MENDLVSRQALLALPRSVTKTIGGEIVEETVDIEDIKNLPSAQKTGKWIQDKERRETWFKCSACGADDRVPTIMGEPLWSYCPWCGAKMEGEQDE